MKRFLLDDPPALACYCRVQAHLSVRGQWHDVFVDSLQALASYCSFYLRTASELRTINDPEGRKAVAEHRRAARMGLREFGMVNEDGALIGDGIDPEIARLCEPLPSWWPRLS